VVAAQESVDGELLTNSVGGADHTLVVEGHEAHDREEQQSAVEVRLIEALHERPPLRVISARLDRLADLVPRLLRASHRSGTRTLSCKAQPAVDRRPAAGLGVHEMAGLAAPLPDPAVRLPPVCDRGLDDLAEEAPLVVVGRVAPHVPAPGEVEDLAVCVQLELLSGAVSHANRAGAPIAVKVERVLAQTALAAEAEE